MERRECLLSNLPMEEQTLFRNAELRIMNTEACRFHSAYRVSWSFACAELALRGLNGACSLRHDMSRALCLVCAELLASGAAAPSGFACNSDPVRLEGVCSKCPPAARASSLMLRLR